MSLDDSVDLKSSYMSSRNNDYSEPSENDFYEDESLNSVPNRKREKYSLCNRLEGKRRHARIKGSGGFIAKRRNIKVHGIHKRRQRRY